jgi:hypothetical protein
MPITPDILKVTELEKDLLAQYSCPEIQLVRQQAQSFSANEISFNIKSPDPGAIMHSTIWLKFKCAFRMGARFGQGANHANSRAQWQTYPTAERRTNLISDNVMLPGGVSPLQERMFSNVSMSVNGVTF